MEDLYKIEGVSSTNEVGDWTYTVELQPGKEWDSGGNDSGTQTWHIKRATPEFGELTIKGWEAGTTPNSPNCKVTYATTYEVAADKVIYEYSANGSTGWATKTAAELMALPAGSYYVRARINAGDHYAAGTIGAPVAFKLWDGLSKRFTDYVEMTVSGYDGAAVENGVVTVTIRENDPVGFHHSYVTDDQVGFADTLGNILPYEIVQWNVDGVSQFRVKLVSLEPNAKFSFYWQIKPGAEKVTPDTVPAGDAYAIDFGLVHHDGKKVNFWKIEPAITNVDGVVVGRPGEANIAWEAHLNPDGSLKTARAEFFDFGTLGEGEASFRLETQSGADIMSRDMPLEPGTYVATFSLLNPAGEYAPLDAKKITFTIKKATNQISKFSVIGWELGKFDPSVNQPELAARYGADTATYRYGLSPTGPWEFEETNTVNFAVLSELTNNTWYAEVTIPATDNYAVSSAVTEGFTVYKGLDTIYSDSVVLHVDNLWGEELTNFPYLVRLRENEPVGFTYDRAGDLGRNEIGFFLAADDAVGLAGEKLDHEVEVWTTSGTSLIWVRIPRLPLSGCDIKFYWHQKQGASLPGYLPKQVWRDYLAVWHFANASELLVDATGNGYDAIYTNSAFNANASGRVGSCAYQSSSAAALLVTNLDANVFTAPFTFFGSYHAANAPSNVDRIFAGTKFGRAYNTADGWALVNMRSQPSQFLLADAANGSQAFSYAPAIVAGSGSVWGSVALVGNLPGGGARFGYGTDAGMTFRSWSAATFTASTNDFQLLAGGFYGDEIRLSDKVRSDARIQAEFDTVAKELVTADSWGLVDREGRKVTYWTTEPSLNKASWESGETPATLSIGAVAAGTITNYYVSLTTGEIFDEMPTSAGSYKVVVTLDDAAGEYETLLKEIEFDIFDHSPYNGIGGSVGETGRVLLMNRDTNPICPIDRQSYGDTSTTQPTFWEILRKGEGDTSLMLQDGVESALWTKSYGKKLWHLVDCRHGNTFPQSEVVSGLEGLSASQVYLPWSSTSYSFLRRITSVIRSTAGQCVMRNIVDAAVYSSCFADGIGTIYFDAANAWTLTKDTDSEYYRIVVEVATNCVETIDGIDYAYYYREKDGPEKYFTAPVSVTPDPDWLPLPPTDENVLSTNITYDIEWQDTVDEDLQPIQVPVTNGVIVTTNLYAKANWQSVPLQALVRDTNAAAPTLADFKPAEASAFKEGGKVLPLAIRNGGTTNNFYRVIVPVEYRGPARFRIRRETQCPSSMYLIDEGGLILLDNIICSYPAMGAKLAPYGLYDEEKTGKRTLGYENCFSTPFPSVADAKTLITRAKPEYYVNPGNPAANPDDFITKATLWYRWHYLEQKDDGWKSVSLNPRDGFTAMAPLSFTALPGDVDFYYELRMQVPFYEYVDYSGTGLGLGSDPTNDGKPYYTEEQTTRIDRSGDLKRGGNRTDRKPDWFVRVREGASDYEALKLVIRRGDDTTTVTNEMEIIGDGVWRGVYKTVAGDTRILGFHVEGVNRQTPGTTEFVTNVVYWTDSQNEEQMPVSSLLEPGKTAADFTTLPCDATTGYLLFQIDENTRSLTVVHADYMNFNNWNDAKGNLFVGRSDTDAKSGVSPKQRDYTEGYGAGWKEMPATNQLWTVLFPNALNAAGGYPGYETFASSSYNGWAVGQGMWVNELYQDNLSGVALQMEGQGRGYLQFVDASYTPRGLEEISFDARLAQAITFDDFCYYGAGAKESRNMKSYCLSARVAFDQQSNKGFTGNASLSLVGHYVTDKGCYEARWEQLDAVHETVGGVNRVKQPAAINTKSQRLCIYRWNKSPTRYTSTLLVAWTNNTFDIPATTTAESANYLPMFLSITNRSDGVAIMAGVRKTAIAGNVAEVPTGNPAAFNGTDWYCAGVLDTSAERLEYGTYGVLSANCPGVFVNIAYRETALAPYSQMIDEANHKTNKRNSGQVTLTFSKDFYGCYSDIAAEYWENYLGRMEQFSKNNSFSGLKACAPSQSFTVYYAPAGRADSWKPLKTVTVSSFGKSENMTFPLYTIDDCSVRIAVDGYVTDRRTDIVIDNVILKQFRGDRWASNETVSYVPTGSWTADGYTNFTFSSAWIRKGEGNKMGVLLSGKRTAPGTPSAVRSPLFDGMYGRGLGLGMFGFEFDGAQTGVKLVLQIATNVTYATFNASTADTLDPNLWHDYTNFTFTAGESGSRAVYLGLHGVKGAMRLLLDPSCVTAAQGQTNPSQFREIHISKVYCRDEPALDASCWWGWNIRTVGANESGSDSEKRMYLSDFSTKVDELGLSLAINNAVKNPGANVLPDGRSDAEYETYRQHMPFVQTPTFTSDVVGEVQFRARKYDKSTQPAEAVLYGATKGRTLDADDTTWDLLAHFTITNDTYSTYSFKTDPNTSYAAFRLAVTGVPGVRHPGPAPEFGDGGRDPVRVLVDEFLVCEAVRCRMAFRHVGAFRDLLAESRWVPDVPSEREQPLVKEAWGVQCELFAAQLADEIDFTRTPKVFLHWYDGEAPWGYAAWRDRPHGRAQLSRATGTNLVYRSSYLTSPDAVVPMSMEHGTVQYMLETIYYQIGSDVPMTNFLTSADWSTPDWYAPIDLNAEKGDENNFAAYNILDTVAPHWSWINEFNLFGKFDDDGSNSDSNYQYVEVAAPVEADLHGWHIDLVESLGDDFVVTNTLATFGDNLSGTKDAFYAASNMVFHLIANPNSRNNGLYTADGTLDGVWAKGGDLSNSLGVDGYISPYNYIGLRLMRPSGIIEHEIVVIGKDFWEDYAIGMMLSPTGTVAALNRSMKGSRFFYAGSDNGPEDCSVSVIDSRGEVSNVWVNARSHTPGRINIGQNIDPDHPTPNGTSIIVYANVDNVFGHIYQTVGGAVHTNGSQIISIMKGSAKGTNITYQTDAWYELGPVTTLCGGKTTTASATPVGERTWVVNVAANASNNVTVTAAAVADSKLSGEFGLTDRNRYTPAVMKWLEEGVDAFGNPWAHPDSGEIALADYINMAGQVVTNLSLTQMYWLDMDPTVSNLAFKAGMATPPSERILDGYMGSAAVTGRVNTVFMMITNRANGEAWSPYCLRGLAPGETSLGYGSDSYWGWTSVTFKVTGVLANGLTSDRPGSENWVPLRWFVFHPDSFYTPADAAADPSHAAFTTRIEVADPYSTESPGYAAGWKDWVDEHGMCPVFHSWSIDTRIRPINVEVQKRDNPYYWGD